VRRGSVFRAAGFSADRLRAAGFRAAGFRAGLRAEDFGAEEGRVRRFRLGRLTERRADLAFRADRVDFGRREPFRLAMVESFRNLDSLAISVVRSVAYRKSASLGLGPLAFSPYPPLNSGPPAPASQDR